MIINRQKVNWLHSSFSAIIYLAFIVGLIYYIDEKYGM